MLVADELLLPDLLTGGDMLEKGLVARALITPRAAEHEHLEYFLHATMHLDRLHSASAIHDSAGPAALHFDTIFTVETVAADTLQREGRHDKFAQSANEHIDCWPRTRRFIYLV